MSLDKLLQQVSSAKIKARNLLVNFIMISVTFLPSIEDNIKFDLLFYTKDDVEVENWDPNTAHIIQGDSDSVKLRSWSSKIHKINTAVTYKK